MFRVVVHKRASKELRNLQKAHLRKFAELVDVLKIDPILWRRFDNRTIHILKVERRGKVY